MSTYEKAGEMLDVMVKNKLQEQLINQFGLLKDVGLYQAYSRALKPSDHSIPDTHVNLRINLAIVDSSPSFSPILGFQPSSLMREESHSFRGVPLEWPEYSTLPV